MAQGCLSPQERQAQDREEGNNVCRLDHGAHLCWELSVHITTALVYRWELRLKEARGLSENHMDNKEAV